MNNANSVSPAQAVLRAEELYKVYGHGDSVVEVLRGGGVEMTVARGEMVAVVGASGSGKTTLLQILGTLDLSGSGRLLFNDRDLTAMGEKELSRHRNRNVGFIFKFHHLLPEFTALENVMMPGFIRGMNPAELHRRALQLLEQVRVDHRASHRSGEWPWPAR